MQHQVQNIFGISSALFSVKKTGLSRLILIQFIFAFSFLAISTTEAQEMASSTTGVNFRQSPNGTIITAIPKGDYVKILGRSGKWSKVQLASGKTGYIFSKYLTTKLNSEAEGGFCAICRSGGEVAQGLQTSENAQKVMEMVNPVGGPAACITRSIESALMSRWKTAYRGREKGRGDCALAIRKGLNQSGVWAGGGIGHAKDMVPGLKRMGFINLKDKNPKITPETAPAGTLLVYGAAAPKNRRYCKGLGTTFGHIEYKQTHRPKRFLYDGRPHHNIQDAYGASCRPLIGVMQMSNSCPTCSKKLKKSCGA